MAPPRRTSSGPGAVSSQQQLSFHAGAGTGATKSNANPKTKTTQDTRNNRVSKPISAAARSSLASSLGRKAAVAVLAASNASLVSAVDIDVDVESTHETPTKSQLQQDAVVQEEAEAEAEEEEEEEIDPTTHLALQVTQAQIARYWTAREAERKAPRVHQRELTVREKVLREFDMSSRYGPSIGIPRIKRWRRAHALSMAPMIEVLAVLMKEDREGRGAKAGRSIVDELMDGKVEV